MAHARAVPTARLLRARASARRGLLASATATVGVAVATVCTLLAWLAAEVWRAGDAAPPGVPHDEVAAQVDAGVIALVSAAPALVLLVVILAATAAAQLARLLAAAREQETANLRARGLSRRQATVANALEAAAVGALGGAVGVVLAVIVLALVNHGAAGMLSVWPAGVATAVILAAVMVVASRPRAAASARGARVTTAAAVVLVLLAAAFVLWQLPLARPAGFDPVAAIAPTVVLMAGALLALAVFGAGSAAWAIAAASRPGLAPSYPVRQVARRLPIAAVAVLLVGLTVAQVVFAAAYSSTWTAMVTDSAALRAGADLRVDLQPAAATPATVAEAASVDGVDAAAPALVVPIEVGSTTAQLVAVPAAAIGTVVSAAGGIVDREALAAAVAPADGSVSADPLELGVSASALRATISVSASRDGAAAAVVLTATVLDANGAATSFRLVGTPEGQPDGTVRVIAEAPLPAGTGPWRLLAVTASVPASFANTTVEVALLGLEAVGGEPLDVGGSVVLDQGVPEQVVWLGDGDGGGDGAGAAGSDGTADGAGAEGAGATGADAAPVRVVLSAALATRLGLDVGDEVEFRYAGTGRRGGLVVADIVQAVPGAASGVAAFAPLEVLETSMLQRGTSLVSATSVWAAGSPSADVALSAALDDRPVATSAPGVSASIVAALVGGWWIAAAGSVILSLVAAFAIAQTLALARRRELGVLRALGVPHGRQARMRAGELSGVLGASVVLGIPAGVLVSWVLVPDLVRAVTPGILPLGTTVTFAWPGLIAALVVLAAGLAAIVVATALEVRRAARTATVGEDAR
jgi:ABC-type lipoprotein release transport system permease subunit